MKTAFIAIGAAMAGMALTHAQAVGAGPVSIPGAIGTLQMQVSDMQAMRFRNVVRQRYDFSCGSAVIATLLSYHYELPTTEAEAFSGMYELGDQERIQREGFSMLDMKRYLAGIGLRADGFRIPMGMLAELGVPAIALVEIRGYRHFVVIKGLQDGHVLVGDPALGIARYSMAAFEALRSNDILFLVRDRVESARTSFNSQAAWAAIVDAPYEVAMPQQSLATFTLALPRPSDW